MDKLDDLFKMQVALQKRLKNIPFKDLKHRQEFINLMVLAMQDEILEALRESAWKNPKYIKGGWQKRQGFDMDRFTLELVDAWHFLINLSIAADLDSRTLHEFFVRKNKENNKRQDQGY